MYASCSFVSVGISLPSLVRHEVLFSRPHCLVVTWCARGECSRYRLYGRSWPGTRGESVFSVSMADGRKYCVFIVNGSDDFSRFTAAQVEANHAVACLVNTPNNGFLRSWPNSTVNEGAFLSLASSIHPQRQPSVSTRKVGSCWW